MPPRVLNIREAGLPAGAVYVGRPSKWGNMWTHLAGSMAGTILVASREEAIARYRAWLYEHPEVMEVARRELRGRDLVCYCAPQACHADVLLQVANGEEVAP